MKTICFYHGGCADGILSAAIVKHKHKNTECIGCKYGDNPDEATYKDAIVYISDFSFEPQVMKNILLKSKQVHWNDHHQTAKDKNPELWNDKNVPGLRQMDKAGCMLTWNYIYPDSNPPLIVVRINDRDLWKNEYPDSTIFHEAFDHFITIPENVLDYELFWNDERIKELKTVGTILAEAKTKRVDRAFKIGFERNIQGKRTWCVNSTIDTSDIGNYSVKQGYDAAIVFSKTRDVWHYSVRSIDNKTALEIATHYGGGGHPNAASFKLKEYIL